MGQKIASISNKQHFERLPPDDWLTRSGVFPRTWRARPCSAALHSGGQSLGSMCQSPRQIFLWLCQSVCSAPNQLDRLHTNRTHAEMHASPYGMFACRKYRNKTFCLPELPIHSTEEVLLWYWYLVFQRKDWKYWWVWSVDADEM